MLQAWWHHPTSFGMVLRALNYAPRYKYKLDNPGCSGCTFQGFDIQYAHINQQPLSSYLVFQLTYIHHRFSTDRSPRGCQRYLLFCHGWGCVALTTSVDEGLLPSYNCILRKLRELQDWNSVSKGCRHPLFLMIQSGYLDDDGGLRSPSQYLAQNLRLPTPPRTLSPSTAYQRPQSDGVERDGSRTQSQKFGSRPYLHPPPPPPPPPPPLHLLQAEPGGGEDARWPVDMVHGSARLVNNNNGRNLPAEKDPTVDMRREIESLREHLRTLRFDYAARRQEFVRQASSFLELSSRATTHRGFRTATAGHRDVMQRVFDDINVLESTYQVKEKELDGLRQRLGRTEALHHSQRLQVYNAPSVPPSSSVSTHSTTLPPDNSDTDSTTESSQNPFVDRYYDRIGDIHLIRERMFNFEAEHRRQLAVRAALWRNRQNLEPPDPIFYERYFNKRADFIRDYSAASQEVQQLSLICREQGLEIEEPNLPSFSETQALDRTRRDQQSLSFVNPASVDGNASVLVQRLADDIDTKARVAVWLSDVKKEEPEQHPLITHQETDRPKSNFVSGIYEVLTSPEPRQDIMDDPPLISQYIPFRSPLHIVQTPDSDHDFTNLEDQTADVSAAESKQPFSNFQADPPRRRYSDPCLPPNHFPHSATSGFDVSRRSCQGDQASKSVC
jgi:hypothetical protein